MHCGPKWRPGTLRKKQAQVVITHYSAKLERSKLNESTTATSYINKFNLCCRKLESWREGFSENTKKTKFLLNILDLDYSVVWQNLEMSKTATLTTVSLLFIFAKATSIGRGFRPRDESLACCSSRTKRKRKGHEKNPQKYDIPSIPHFILNKVEPPSVSKALIKWWGMYIHQGHMIRPDEVDLTPKKEGQEGDSPRTKDDCTPEKAGNKRCKKNKKVRCTTTVSSGSSNPIVLLKDEKEREQVNHNHLQGRSLSDPRSWRHGVFLLQPLKMNLGLSLIPAHRLKWLAVLVGKSWKSLAMALVESQSLGVTDIDAVIVLSSFWMLLQSSIHLCNYLVIHCHNRFLECSSINSENLSATSESWCTSQDAW